MSNFIECSVEIQNLIMSVMEFCLVLEFILILLRMTGSAHLRRKITVTVLFGVTFLGTVLLQCVQKYDAKALEQSLFLNVPIVVMLCGIAGLTFYLVRSILKEIRREKQRLSPWSVKEAVDNAPCGVCFANAFDQIILCNSKMREVSKMLLGTKLQNYKMLHQAISEGNIREEIISMSSDGSVFAFPDGKVWMFQEYQLKDRELAGYRQAIALDVSEIYYNSERIKFNNEKLETLNQQLEEMYEKIGDEIREQETLAMKMKVHDNFGRSLLSIRRILEKKEEPGNMRVQLETLKQQVYILTSSTADNKENQYEDTKKHARELGISIQIQGNYPDDLIYGWLTDRALRECVTNCARHAHGTAVYVEIKRNMDGYQIQITNDGEPPLKNAKEGGGLSALRKAVEAEHGTMKTFFEPAFYLFLNFPLKR